MIDNSYLLGLFGGTSTFSSGVTGFSPASTARKAQPTPPWDTTLQSVARNEAALRAAMGGRDLINEDAAQLDVKGASQDYRKLFALYQGLDALSALAGRAGEAGVSSTELALVQRRFAEGLSEISGYLDSVTLDSLRLTQGVTSSLSKSTAGVARDTSKTLTGPIHSGAPTSVVEAFQGDVRFSMTIANVAGGVQIGAAKTVDIDLADMGATPRSLSNVIGHINTKLEAAGVQTRVGREMIPSEPRTVQVGDKTVSLPDGADQWALMLRGSSTEAVTFTAPETRDAVYVVQGSGTDGAGRELLKFDVEGGVGAAGLNQTHWVEGRVGQTALPPGVDSVRASATAADGSLWMVADLSAGSDSQPIKGQSDVALMKYDSAGRLLFTRTLGAADQASGYALSVADDGRVAVAGSVTGALTVAGSTASVLSGSLTGADAAKSDSFVTVFDAAGVEQWTQRRGAREADEATSVTFGDDGQVYVAGRSKSAIPGAGAVGGWDGYVQAFSASQAYPSAPVTAKAGFALQFGTSGEDTVSSVVVDGGNLYTAGVENGRATVRKYALTPGGAPTLTATRDLGPISGEIAGLSVQDGRVILAGTTRNGALDAGVVTNAHAGGTEAFVAALSDDLAAGPDDRLTYYGGSGDDTVADVKLHEGQVWITGVSNRAAGAEDEDPTEAYLARIDPTTGAVGWSRTWQGVGQQAAPMTLAVADNGASVLDRLGLPQGRIVQSDSKLLTAATSLRVGDRFSVVGADGGRPKTVTIEARDTLQSLARKIEQASQMTLKVTVASEGGEVTGKDGETILTMGGLQRLSISARSGREGASLVAGEAGRDALAGLGLDPGFIGPVGSADDGPKTYGLNLSRNLTVSDADTAKTTSEAILAAMKAVRDAYRGLAPQSANPAIAGQAPAYMTARIANYQAALARLGG